MKKFLPAAMLLLLLASCTKEAAIDTVDTQLTEKSLASYTSEVTHGAASFNGTGAYNQCFNETVQFRGTVPYTINVVDTSQFPWFSKTINYTFDFSNVHGISDTRHLVYTTDTKIDSATVYDPVVGSVPFVVGYEKVYITFQTPDGHHLFYWTKVAIFAETRDKVRPEFYGIFYACD